MYDGGAFMRLYRAMRKSVARNPAPARNAAKAKSHAAGDRSAFEPIARRFGPRLVRFAARSVGWADANDVVQEALMKAFLRAGRYDRRWNVTTWLFTLTRHAVFIRNPLLRALGRRFAGHFESDSQWKEPA